MLFSSFLFISISLIFNIEVSHSQSFIENVCNYVGPSLDCNAAEALCQVCNEGTFCSQCQQGYFKLSNDLDQCISCELIPNCNFCTDYQGCQQCSGNAQTIINSCGIRVCPLGPTREPTPRPTAPPTLDPSVSPTNIPSQSPTSSPSPNPTKSPSDNPTRDPSIMPSMEPSNDPTRIPTSFPTDDPTNAPTSAPTPLDEQVMSESASNGQLLLTNEGLGDLNLTLEEVQDIVLNTFAIGIEICLSGIGCAAQDVFIFVYIFNPCDIERDERITMEIADINTRGLFQKFCIYCRHSINGVFWLNGYRYLHFDNNGAIDRLIEHYDNENAINYVRSQSDTARLFFPVPDVLEYEPLFSLEEKFNVYTDDLLNDPDNTVNIDDIINTTIIEFCYNSFECGGIEILFYQALSPICDTYDQRKIEKYTIDNSSLSIMYEFCMTCEDSVSGFFWFSGMGYLQFDENGLITRIVEHWQDENAVTYFTNALENGKTIYDVLFSDS